MSMDVMNFLVNSFKGLDVKKVSIEPMDASEIQETAVLNILRRLRDIDDEEYTNATLTKKSMGEFERFFEKKTSNLMNFPSVC
jgi:hypothetical protein